MEAGWFEMAVVTSSFRLREEKKENEGNKGTLIISISAAATAIEVYVQGVYRLSPAANNAVLSAATPSEVSPTRFGQRHGPRNQSFQ